MRRCYVLARECARASSGGASGIVGFHLGPSRGVEPHRQCSSGVLLFAGALKSSGLAADLLTFIEAFLLVLTVVESIVLWLLVWGLCTWSCTSSTGTGPFSGMLSAVSAACR